MSRAAVVYWSGTGNTEQMAEAVCEGIKETGTACDLLQCGDFDLSKVEEYDAIAFGCPAMGGEELEDTEFAPMFNNCLEALLEKKIALFGSYGWGDGEWMNNWETTCKNAGITLQAESVICNGEPEEDALEECRALGKALL